MRHGSKNTMMNPAGLITMFIAVVMRISRKKTSDKALFVGGSPVAQTVHLVLTNGDLMAYIGNPPTDGIVVYSRLINIPKDSWVSLDMVMDGPQANCYPFLWLPVYPNKPLTVHAHISRYNKVFLAMGHPDFGAENWFPCSVTRAYWSYGLSYDVTRAVYQTAVNVNTWSELLYREFTRFTQMYNPTPSVVKAILGTCVSGEDMILNFRMAFIVVETDTDMAQLMCHFSNLLDTMSMLGLSMDFLHQSTVLCNVMKVLAEQQKLTRNSTEFTEWMCIRIATRWKQLTSDMVLYDWNDIMSHPDRSDIVAALDDLLYRFEYDESPRLEQVFNALLMIAFDNPVVLRYLTPFLTAVIRDPTANVKQIVQSITALHDMDVFSYTRATFAVDIDHPKRWEARAVRYLANATRAPCPISALTSLVSGVQRFIAKYPTLEDQTVEGALWFFV